MTRYDSSNPPFVAQATRALGEDAPPAFLRVSERVLEDLNTFIRDELPLLELLATPGLRDRHWKDMEQTTGLRLRAAGPPTLQRMVDAGLHRKVRGAASGRGRREVAQSAHSHRDPALPL